MRPSKGDIRRCLWELAILWGKPPPTKETAPKGSREKKNTSQQHSTTTRTGGAHG